MNRQRKIHIFMLSLFFSGCLYEKKGVLQIPESQRNEVEVACREMASKESLRSLFAELKIASEALARATQNIKIESDLDRITEKSKKVVSIAQKIEASLDSGDLEKKWDGSFQWNILRSNIPGAVSSIEAGKFRFIDATAVSFYIAGTEIPVSEQIIKVENFTDHLVITSEMKLSSFEYCELQQTMGILIKVEWEEYGFDRYTGYIKLVL